MRLDAKTIVNLTLPTGKAEQIYWDSELHGFGLRLRLRGRQLRRTWIAQYRSAGRTRRPTLGSADTLLPAEARTAARKVLANVALGGDPQQEREAKRQAATRTFRAVVGCYLEARERELRPSSYRVSKLYLTGAYFRPLHACAVSEITHADIAACIRTIERERSAATAAAARRALSTLFGWAIAEGLMGKSPVNPVIGTRRPADPTPRDRVLTSGELAAIWHATGSDADYDRIIRLLALLGSRASEKSAACAGAKSISRPRLGAFTERAQQRTIEPIKSCCPRLHSPSSARFRDGPVAIPVRCPRQWLHALVGRQACTRQAARRPRGNVGRARPSAQRRHQHGGNWHRSARHRGRAQPPGWPPAPVSPGSTTARATTRR